MSAWKRKKVDRSCFGNNAILYRTYSAAYLVVSYLRERSKNFRKHSNWLYLLLFCFIWTIQGEIWTFYLDLKWFWWKNDISLKLGLRWGLTKLAAPPIFCKFCFLAIRTCHFCTKSCKSCSIGDLGSCLSIRCQKTSEITVWNAWILPKTVVTLKIQLLQWAFAWMSLCSKCLKWHFSHPTNQNAC